MSIKNYLVCYGNVWLQTDDNHTKINWVRDRALASRHTKEWCEELQKLLSPKLQIHSWEEALQLAESERKAVLKAEYFYKMQDIISKKEPDATNPIPGNGAAPWMYAVDINFHTGVSVEKAVREFLKGWRKSHKKRKK